MNLERFEIAGVNPTTGKMATLCLLAPSRREARSRAELCGLLFVQVRAAPAVESQTALPFWASPRAARLCGGEGAATR